MIFAVVALALTATTVAFASANTFAILATAVFFAGLALDGLIGDEIRAVIGIER